MAEKKVKTVTIAAPEDEDKEESVKEIKPLKKDEEEDEEEVSEDEDEDNKKESVNDTKKSVDNQNKTADNKTVDNKTVKTLNQDADDTNKAVVEEERIDGMLTVLSEMPDGKFGNMKQYYVRFFFKGQFLVFFNQPDVKTIPVFYVKVKYILAIEDFFNTNPMQVYVEYYDGKKENRIVFMISDIKIKDKWIDTMSSLKDELEDLEDNQYEDFGRSEVEMKYHIACEYERRIIRNSVAFQTRII